MLFAERANKLKFIAKANVNYPNLAVINIKPETK